MENELIEIAQKKIESFKPDELKSAGFLPLNGLYFPAIYYPPITMYPLSNECEIFNNFTYDSDVPVSLYIHIPFCPVRCLYCHWVVSVGNSQEEMDLYLKNLGKEMDMYSGRFGMKTIAPRSVLIGGGTPSMLSPRQTESLLRTLRSKFDLSKCSQITCEAEPGTVLGKRGLDKLKAMKNYGVNRISLGVQAFDDDILKKMGRAHTSLDAADAIKNIRLAGFESLSIDLVYAYPQCSLQKWVGALKTAFSLNIDACQLYRLRIIPHGDKIGMIKKRFDKSPNAFPDINEIYVMKEFGIQFALQNGFREVSRRVFAKSQRYNSEYLKDHCDRLNDVLGIGISSWTNLQGRLYLNTGKSLKEYYSYIDKGKLPIDRGKIRTEDDTERWAAVLPLKHHGISKIKYKEITGKTVNQVFGERIERLKKNGLVTEDERRLSLTEKGAFFADEVVTQFYHSDYMPFPMSSYAAGELNPYNEI